MSRTKKVFLKARTAVPDQTRIVAPGPNERSVRTTSGEVLHPPLDWVLLPPGDAALTRRVKATGPTWTVQEKRGRKIFSQGVWAPATTVERLRVELEAERATPQHARRREREQEDYVAEFRQAVLAFLAFDPRYADWAGRLADAVTGHATPVGSGTVARTRLDDLFVSPPDRRKGAGRLLMWRLAELAIAADCTHIGWVASASNTVGMNFYHRIGATVVHQAGAAVTLPIEPDRLLATIRSVD